MKNNPVTSLLTLLLLTIFSGLGLAAPPADKPAVGAVYTMTNGEDGNQILVFDRDAKGILTKSTTVSTGGTGSGGGLDPLTSQGSLILSQDHRWLLAVNAGSNEISVFRVLPDGLELADRVNSGGVFPVSLTIVHNLVYVLNAGDSPNIAGFTLNHQGHLTPLTGAPRLLASTGQYSQVGFDPKGEVLVVTDRAENTLLLYAVDKSGLPAPTPVSAPSNGPVPFGFIFDQRGHLAVVEAGANAVSSYEILGDSTLRVISPSVANGQVASCWIVGTMKGLVFTGNAATNSVSSYQLQPAEGTIALLEGNAGRGRLDMAVSTNGRFLYALDPVQGTIDTYQIDEQGNLTDLGAVDGGFSLFAQGLAAR